MKYRFELVSKLIRPTYYIDLQVIFFFFNYFLFFLFFLFRCIRHIYGCDSGACVCCASFECIRMMTRMFVLCVPVCSAADALIVAAGCCENIRVHFVAAVFTRVRSLPEVKQNICYYIYALISNVSIILSRPSTQFYLFIDVAFVLY